MENTRLFRRLIKIQVNNCYGYLFKRFNFVKITTYFWLSLRELHKDKAVNRTYASMSYYYYYSGEYGTFSFRILLHDVV